MSRWPNPPAYSTLSKKFPPNYMKPMCIYWKIRFNYNGYVSAISHYWLQQIFGAYLRGI